MPRFWFLEKNNGVIGIIDPDDGKYDPILCNPCPCGGPGSSSGSGGIPPTIQMACCPNPIPQQLYITLFSPDCSCCGGTFPLAFGYDPTNPDPGSTAFWTTCINYPPGFIVLTPPSYDMAGNWVNIPCTTSASPSFCFQLTCDSGGSPCGVVGCSINECCADPLATGCWDMLLPTRGAGCGETGFFEAIATACSCEPFVYTVHIPHVMIGTPPDNVDTGWEFDGCPCNGGCPSIGEMYITIHE